MLNEIVLNTLNFIYEYVCFRGDIGFIWVLVLQLVQSWGYGNRESQIDTRAARIIGGNAERNDNRETAAEFKLGRMKL